MSPSTEASTLSTVFPFGLLDGRLSLIEMYSPPEPPAEGSGRGFGGGELRDSLAEFKASPEIRIKFSPADYDRGFAFPMMYDATPKQIAAAKAMVNKEDHTWTEDHICRRSQVVHEIITPQTTRELIY